MGSTLTQLAESLLQHVKGQAPYDVGGLQVVFERRVLPYFDRQELGSLTRVVVVPETSGQTLLARAASGIRQQTNLTVGVYVQSAADPGDVTKTDAVAELADDLLAVVVLHDPSTDGLSLVGASYDPVSVTEHLQEYHVYTSRIVVTYSMVV